MNNAVRGCWRGLVLGQMKHCRGAHLQGREDDCRRLADGQIVSRRERVRQKLVWDAAVVQASARRQARAIEGAAHGGSGRLEACTTSVRRKT